MNHSAFAVTFFEDTNNSDHYIRVFNDELRCLYQGTDDSPARRKEAEETLMHWSLQLANANVHLKKGGPFGAIVVDFETDDGIPRVVGVGTNHVVPNNDPSAHAEMTAIRDTAKRLGRTDFSGLTMITSCECCPMCLSAVMGSGIETLRYGLTRKDAAAIGFSDDDQYRIMKEGVHTQSQKIPEADYQAIEKKLGWHDAAIIIPTDKGDKIYFGDNEVDRLNDPTALPCVQAIRSACKDLGFHLPENARLVSRYRPHPMSLVTADWARIGRVRDPEHPDDPSKDSGTKNTSAIAYLDDRPETIHNLKATELMTPDTILREISLPDESRVISSRKIGEGMPPIVNVTRAELERQQRLERPFTEWTQRTSNTAPDKGAVKY